MQQQAKTKQENINKKVYIHHTKTTHIKQGFALPYPPKALPLETIP
jgi:hypothetical protein